MPQCCRNCYSGAPESWTQDRSVTSGACRFAPPSMGEMQPDPADPKKNVIVTSFMPVNLDKFWCRKWESRWAILRIAQKLLGF